MLIIVSKFCGEPRLPLVLEAKKSTDIVETKISFLSSRQNAYNGSARNWRRVVTNQETSLQPATNVKRLRHPLHLINHLSDSCINQSGDTSSTRCHRQTIASSPACSSPPSLDELLCRPIGRLPFSPQTSTSGTQKLFKVWNGGLLINPVPKDSQRIL
ncbi:hypothetical protein TNCV_4529881 [Trichonephila clavipes]|nr:hypothetical protein TNCV_4529881 [Trichonephila clavipes]